MQQMYCLVNFVLLEVEKDRSYKFEKEISGLVWELNYILSFRCLFLKIKNQNLFINS